MSAWASWVMSAFALHTGNTLLLTLNVRSQGPNIQPCICIWTPLNPCQTLINTFPYFSPSVNASWEWKWVCFGCPQCIPARATLSRFSQENHWLPANAYVFLPVVVCHGPELLRAAQVKSSVCIMETCLSRHTWINQLDVSPTWSAVLQKRRVSLTP